MLLSDPLYSSYSICTKNVLDLGENMSTAEQQDPSDRISITRVDFGFGFGLDISSVSM